ncbi:DedA family protein [Nocardia sp. CNY236]|uniref:DedA family protein n=1 Tax=Nocardia sp. CNY236 TaxID=1169152 RepID=UPI00055B332C|nr:DedA family protein [Nocardia sp. CNY236]
MPLAMGSFDPLMSAGPTLVWAVVVTFVFLECAVIFGLFLPGDSMLVTAGIVLASHSAGEQHVWALSLGAMVAAIAGNQVGYAIGQRAGQHLVARKGGRYVNVRNVQRVSEFLLRYGFVAVLVARWIPWVRTLCPSVAGAARMDHRTFTVASTIGAIVWAPVLLLIGYYAGGFVAQVPWLMPIVIGILVAALIVATIVGIRRYQREMSQPAEDFSLAPPPTLAAETES